MEIKKNVSRNKDLIIAGAGIGALAVAAYFFTGPGGKKNQQKMKGWMVKMRGEVIDRLEDVKEITEPVYHDIVDTVAQAQTVSDKIPRAEIARLADELKRDWRTITKLSKGKRPVTKKRAKRASSSSKKKTTKKKAA